MKNFAAVRPTRPAVLVGLVVVCALGVGCGGVAEGVRSAGSVVGPTPEAADHRIPATHGLYCRAVAGAAPTWTGGDAEGFAAFWVEHRRHEHAATITAPTEIADDWAEIATFTRDVATPMVEAGDLDAPPTEPSNIAGLRARVATYDLSVCGIG